MTAASAPALVEARSPAAMLWRAIGLVLGFWWCATGAIIALQRNETTRVLGLALTTGLLGVSLLLARRSRNDCTVAGTRRGFMAGSLAWLWVAATFYGGWIVGPAPILPAAGAGLLERGVLAAYASLWHELASVLVLAAAIAIGGTNRTTALTLGIFWGADLLARVNVLIGVRNAAGEILPEHLAFFSAFVGPERNTPFLAVSAFGLVAAAAWVLRPGGAGGEAYLRYRGQLFATLLGLAALEHVLLSVAWSPPLWEFFLAMRGS